MQILCDSRSLLAALQCQAELARLITGYIERLSDVQGSEIGDLVQFVIMDNHDAILDLEAALGFSVMTNRSNGTRFGDPDFLPSWEVIEAHQFWYELVFVLADDGFGIVVLVHKEADSCLLQMLQHYSPSET